MLSAVAGKSAAKRHGRWLVLAAVAAGLSACANSGIDDKTAREGRKPDRDPSPFSRQQTYGESLFGPGGLFGARAKGDGESGIAVNSFLWRATLDTLSFMPLASADPFGGVIITDWYSPPESPNERVKISVLILDRDLRADGLRATVFRQQNAGGRGWVDVAVDPKTGLDVENAILTRARQLRIAQGG